MAIAHLSLTTVTFAWPHHAANSPRAAAQPLPGADPGTINRDANPKLCGAWNDFCQRGALAPLSAVASYDTAVEKGSEKVSATLPATLTNEEAKQLKREANPNAYVCNPHNNYCNNGEDYHPRPNMCGVWNDFCQSGTIAPLSTIASYDTAVEKGSEKVSVTLPATLTNKEVKQSKRETNPNPRVCNAANNYCNNGKDYYPRPKLCSAGHHFCVDEPIAPLPTTASYDTGVEKGSEKVSATLPAEEQGKTSEDVPTKGIEENIVPVSSTPTFEHPTQSEARTRAATAPQTRRERP
ncbi:hypothetical protein EV356DRAFT_505722 [Viridothelium virens]|uniref:Uncharacterized protein n=1 Tax=Viridothelium virens TaxID=1048519 RepID=A0A6A6H3I4_VIRVR|nr:hypothetical protein EV356DRAFT_505722 [Viridothelium virens]